MKMNASYWNTTIQKPSLIIGGTLLAIIFSLSSCLTNQGNKGSYSTTRSETTGWNYNDPSEGGFLVNSSPQSNPPPGMVLVEGGVFEKRLSNEDIYGGANSFNRAVTINSFYMDQYEVTNVAWKEYLNWIKFFYSSSPHIYKAALPDSTVWRSELSYNEPMLRQYFAHPGYNKYPVVGVSWEQAMQYCKWRSDRVNELLLSNTGYKELPNYTQIDSEGGDRKGDAFSTDRYLTDKNIDNDIDEKGRTRFTDAFGNPKKISQYDGVLTSAIRLPTEAEWEYAAYAVRSIPGTNTYNEQRSFPWEGYYLRDPDEKELGNFRTNFKRGRGDYMGQAGSLNDGYAYTAPVDAYVPNDLGLYSMAGNVNEWVLDVYRPSTSQDAEELSPFRGNIFTRDSLDANNEVVLDEFGQRIKVLAIDTTKEGSVIHRDYRNFRDGDGSSSVDRLEWSHREDFDQLTAKQYNPDQGSPVSILNEDITDNSRIYKGGSWEDLAYWLNPSRRRYMDQKESSSTVGFRCVMDRAGGNNF